ncbi:hypothetical protein ACFYS8_23090 [Kitasatospora sp. NPDC004615]|uniref:hypothetical protein n=1 Tax=Kitasatospora sp. NPDC004615 TaxID=3364017 RepID=UPI00368AC5C8
MAFTWATDLSAGTWAESATQARFGAGATKSRSIRSDVRAAAGTGIVVVTFLPAPRR